MTALSVVESVAPVRRAGELAEAAAAGGADRLLPVAGELRPLLSGLRRGSTVAVSPGIRSLVLALLAAASGAGSWSAVVGMPGLSGLAAAQAGVDLQRLALVPYPGPDWPTVVAALLDGVDVVVVAPPGPATARVASRLAARARQRGSVLMPYGQWVGADLTVTAGQGAWEGLAAGHGRLRCRELTITAHGRGAATRPRWVRVRLPGATGRLAPARPAAIRPAAARPVTAPAGAALAGNGLAGGGPADPGRPGPPLTVIDGGEPGDRRGEDLRGRRGGPGVRGRAA